MIEITINDYQPDAAIGGNRRGHWSRTSAAIRLARDTGFAAAREMMAENSDLPFLLQSLPLTGNLHLDYTVTMPRPMDIDNVVQALKPVLDGIEDAGVIATDRDFTSMSIRVQRRLQPQVVIRINTQSEWKAKE